MTVHWHVGWKAISKLKRQSVEPPLATRASSAAFLTCCLQKPL
jgi:hypothetical protein